MRTFDPPVLGRLETAAWVAYYRRDWVRFLRAAIGLTRHAFNLSWPRSLYGAWLVLRANQLWAPYPDNDPARCRALMAKFYALVARTHHETFDVQEAAALEVEWWRVHREHQREERDAHRDELVDALAELYAHVYGVPAASVRPAAEERALAMRESDLWVGEGCDLASRRIRDERAALTRSYAELLAAVHG